MSNKTDKKEVIHICDTCKHSKTFNTKKGKMTTEFVSPESYDWDKYEGALCTLAAVGFNKMSKCSEYKTNKLEKLN